MTDIEFAGEVWFWRGPAPWYFITVPEEECAFFQAESGFVRAEDLDEGDVPTVRLRIRA